MLCHNCISSCVNSMRRNTCLLCVAVWMTETSKYYTIMSHFPSNMLNIFPYFILNLDIDMKQAHKICVQYCLNLSIAGLMQSRSLINYEVKITPN